MGQVSKDKLREIHPAYLRNLIKEAIKNPTQNILDERGSQTATNRDPSVHTNNAVKSNSQLPDLKVAKTVSILKNGPEDEIKREFRKAEQIADRLLEKES